MVIKIIKQNTRSQFYARVFIMWGVFDVVALEFFRLLIFFIILTDFPGAFDHIIHIETLTFWVRKEY